MTGSGKSFQLGIKFFFKVFNAPKRESQFVIAASNVKVVEKMFINNPTSFYSIFNTVCQHKEQGVGGNRIIVDSPTGQKIIYLVGYDDKNRYKDILGLSIFGFLVEEVHVAGDEFIREMFTRVYRDKGFLYTSSNGGLPEMIIYRDYLNKARPHPKYEQEVPGTTMKELLEKEADDMFEFWFYRFEDNAALDQKQIEELYSAHPVGSFEYNSKILGIRGYVEGLIYTRYLNPEKNMVKFDEVYGNPQSPYPMVRYTIGIDVGSTDFTVFTLKGFTRFYKHSIALDKLQINHAGVNEIWAAFVKWFNPYYELIGSKVYGAFIDSAAQILKSSLAPLFMSHYNMNIANSYKFTIKERVDWGIRFIHQGRKLFTERCKDTYDAYNNTLYAKNLHATDIRVFPKHIYKDLIDSDEYSETPFIREMLNTQ